MILIVEDQTLIRMNLIELLRQSGMEAVGVGNAEDALAYCQKIKPDLIILDIMLPKMSGLELMKILQKDLRTERVPVIFLTALDNEETKITGLQNGAVDFLTKPFVFKELLAKVKNILRVSTRSPWETPEDQASSDRERVVEYIQNNIKSNINVEDLANAMSMSRSTLQRLTIRHFDLSPKDLITHTKMKFALHLIEKGQTNVSEISFAVGYNNVNNFITAFKQKMNSTPKEYIKQHLQNTNVKPS